ncbi:MAG: hypothetical protein ACRKGH_03730 [Dehalogenimonas sp.]
MAKSERVLLGAGLLGLAYLYLNKSVTLPGGGDGANPPGWDETEGGTRSSITPKEFATWEERQQYFLNLPEDQRPLSYFTKEPIDPTQPAGSPANPLSPLKPFGAIISWEEWYDIRNVQATGISKTEFVAKAKGWHLGYTLELIRTRGQGGAIQVYDSDFEDYFGADWRLWQQALGYGGTANAKFDDAGNYMPDGYTVYDFPIDNSGYQAWINAGNFGGYYDWLATGKDAEYAAYKTANLGGMDYHQWQTANRPGYTVYRTPDGGYTDYWNGQYYTNWLETDNPLLSGNGSGVGGTGVVQLVQISNLRVSATSVHQGGFTTVRFEITNPNGSSVNYDVAFIGNLTNKSFSGSLNAFETASKSFSLSVDFTGTRSASLGGQTISVTGLAPDEPPPPCQPTAQPAPYHDTANGQYIPYYWNTSQCMWLLDYASAYDDGTTPPPDEPLYAYADLPQPYSNCTQRQHDAAVYFGKSYSYYAYGQCQEGIPPVGAYITTSCHGGGL